MIEAGVGVPESEEIWLEEAGEDDKVKFRW